MSASDPTVGLDANAPLLSPDHSSKGKKFSPSLKQENKCEFFRCLLCQHKAFLLAEDTTHSSCSKSWSRKKLFKWLKCFYLMIKLYWQLQTSSKSYHRVDAKSCSCENSMVWYIWYIFEIDIRWSRKKTWHRLQTFPEHVTVSHSKNVYSRFSCSSCIFCLLYSMFISWNLVNLVKLWSQYIWMKSDQNC